MDFSIVTRAASRTVLKAQKASPTLLFGIGVVSVVGGAVLASRATLKAGPVLEKHVQHLEDIAAMAKEHPTYSDRQVVQDKIEVMIEVGIDLGKLYGPALIAGGIGIACLTGSHKILTKRNAALTAAYAALERSYDLYRSKVREDFGEEAEARLHYNVSKELAEQDRLLEGAHKKPKKINYSEYAIFFDEANPNWTRSAEKNLSFLNVQQRVATDILRARGHILLNDVYDMLGHPRTTAGCVVGWTMYGDGDNYVDFGIFNHHTDEVRAFVNGVEKSILLDFNVDGIVYDKIER